VLILLGIDWAFRGQGRINGMQCQKECVYWLFNMVLEQILRLRPHQVIPTGDRAFRKCSGMKPFHFNERLGSIRY
jgi:hypothetical protein